MENQNIQWANWEEQPQENNEQPQVNWGEQPQQEQPQHGWGNQPQQEQLPPKEDNLHQLNSPTSFNLSNESPSNDFEDLDSNNWERHYSFLGKLPKVPVEVLVFKLDYNNEKIINEIINDGFESVDKDNKFKIKYKENTELSKVLHSIKNIGDLRGMSLQHSYLYKNSPRESVLNIAKGDCLFNYIYFTQAEYNSGDVILDFSALNGPSEKILENSPGILLLIPGWVPYRISQNESNKDMVAIAGRYVLPSPK